METIEQLAAVIVTAGLVAGNFLLFTPWRDGVDPRDRQQQSSDVSHRDEGLSASVVPEGQHPHPYPKQ
ncbi:MAG: hypothetical protein CMN91_06455 [Synechococcus sp. ARS1019]|nr:hypothetical protein [Synechococcus sp. ARS1019]